MIVGSSFHLLQGNLGKTLVRTVLGNMKTPLVSVAMVTRNVERFLPEAIESILNQTFKDLEFVIVDFGSTDRSKSIISSYQSKDPRVRFHEIPNCSLPEARSTSCSLSTGRYVAIMDADDIALPDRLSCQLEFVEKHPKVGVLGGDIEWIDHMGRALRTQHFPRGDSKIRETLLSGCPFCNPTVMIRRDILATAGSFRKPFESAEDYDLWLRVAEHCEMANLPRILLRYRRHPHQETQRNVRQQTLGHLAARAAADLRLSGKPDPLDSVREITPEVLLTLGVTEAAWQRAMVAKYRGVIATAAGAGEYSAGLKLAAEMLGSSDWKHVDRWELADVWFKSAQINRRQGKYLQSAIATGRGILVRPVVLARPLKLLMGQMRKFFNLQENTGVRGAS